jgi:hypothetical protein
MALDGTLPPEGGRNTPAPPPAAAPSRMGLRERKPTSYFEGDDDLGKNRRKTVAGASVTASERVCTILGDVKSQSHLISLNTGVFSLP